MTTYVIPLFLGSIIPYIKQPTRVLNTAQLCLTSCGLIVYRSTSDSWQMPFQLKFFTPQLIIEWNWRKIPWLKSKEILQYLDWDIADWQGIDFQPANDALLEQYRLIRKSCVLPPTIKEVEKGYLQNAFSDMFHFHAFGCQGNCTRKIMA